nr:MAG TPA: hypothetical protein [Caudoviricetes sp.]DAK94881.1 MAG TPA: hypothetical protein [Caudoviricetes sp.]
MLIIILSFLLTTVTFLFAGLLQLAIDALHHPKSFNGNTPDSHSKVHNNE